MSAITTASLLPDPPARHYRESNLQRSVHQYLSWALPADAVHFAVPNGLMRSQKARARAQGEGVVAGVPDLCVVFRGRALFVELKAGRGVMSQAQREMARRLNYAGAAVMLCRSVPELEAQLREACVPLRGSVAA
ncbi:MAG TPA: VRR-NUC domain-containing protein [Ktedonobacterales bacterium]|nr:VRR-NUC domain-containing protein [Ktedonobacterales bacterium]